MTTAEVALQKESNCSGEIKKLLKKLITGLLILTSTLKETS